MHNQSLTYPAFFDDAETKTANAIGQLLRKFGPRMGIGAANGVLGTLGGSMVDKMTGGDGSTGAMVGGALGLGTLRMNPAMAARITRTAAPKVLGLQGIDALQRARMGYSTFDPQSVKTHMQDEMAKELEPIIAPWRGMNQPHGIQQSPINQTVGPGGMYRPNMFARFKNWWHNRMTPRTNFVPPPNVGGPGSMPTPGFFG